MFLRTIRDQSLFILRGKEWAESFFFLGDRIVSGGTERELAVANKV